MKTKYQFIHFRLRQGEEGWSCRNNRVGDELGTVEYYYPWRQWVFSPTGPSVYSLGCLNDIAHFITQLSVPCPKEQTVLPF